MPSMLRDKHSKTCAATKIAMIIRKYYLPVNNNKQRIYSERQYGYRGDRGRRIFCGQIPCCNAASPVKA